MCRGQAYVLYGIDSEDGRQSGWDGNPPFDSLSVFPRLQCTHTRNLRSTSSKLAYVRRRETLLLSMEKLEDMLAAVTRAGLGTARNSRSSVANTVGMLVENKRLEAAKKQRRRLPIPQPVHGLQDR